MKKTATTRPSTVETAHNSFRQKVYTINIDIEELEDGTFEYESIELKAGEFTRGGIVSAIIENKYPRQEMDAIVNNYLQSQISGASVEKHLQEMQEMQAYRMKAKEFADKVLGN